MKKVMISQPMAGISDEVIKTVRDDAIRHLTDLGYEVVDNLFTDEWLNKEKETEGGVINIPLRFLAKSIEKMSHCHAVYFCRDWEKTRGCRVEHVVARAYDLTMLYEE